MKRHNCLISTPYWLMNQCPLTDITVDHAEPTPNAGFPMQTNLVILPSRWTHSWFASSPLIGCRLQYVLAVSFWSCVGRDVEISAVHVYLHSIFAGHLSMKKHTISARLHCRYQVTQDKGAPKQRLVQTFSIHRLTRPAQHSD